MTSSSTFSSCWTSLRARSSAMLDRSRSSSIAPLAPGEGGMQTASYYAHFPSLWQPARAWTSSLEFLRGYLLLRPSYRLLVRRAGAQIDAALPLAFERVAHAHPHTANLFQFDLAEFAVLERAQPLMIGATGDDIARVQGHDHAGELDQLWHAVLHVVGDVIMIQVTVVPEPHPQPVGVLDLIDGSNARPDGREGVEALAHPAALAPGAAAFGTGRDIDDASEAEHRLAPVGRLDALGRALD